MNRYCPYCGSLLDLKDKSCSKCGAPITYKNINENKTTTTNVEGKSKIVACILALFLGTLGIHNFYLGYNKKAMLELLLTILSFGILSIISEILAIIDLVMIVTGSTSVDGDGNPLTD